MTPIENLDPVAEGGLVEEKLARMQQSEEVRVLDLFAGCGGLSLGFQTAGFRIVGGIEKNDYAASTYAENIHRHACSAEKEFHSEGRDISEVSPEEYVANHPELSDVAREIDVLVGGPPCQAFTRVGRAKLRDVAEEPDAFLNDPRSNLYLQYMEFVQKIKPAVILIENVPDILNHGGHNVAREVAEVLDELGYTPRYTLLNAAFYGVPQMRERMFLLAYHEDVGVDVELPEPSHHHDLPQGYQGSRDVALQEVETDGIQTSLTDQEDKKRYFYPIPEPDDNLPPAVTAHEAIGDLPEITRHLRGELERGPRRFNELTPYPGPPHSDYAEQMRNWPGFESSDGIWDHTIRNLPRDYPIFRRMNEGDEYPEAHGHAMDLFHEKLEELEVQGDRPDPESEEYQELKDSIVPPYSTDKFPNKWWKMERDNPVRTLMAHLQKDSYTHIHYNDEQARTLSVREGARLQSFPDGFEFEGTMNPAFRQIGNAVPPLLALSLARKISEVLPLPDQEETPDKEVHTI
jgi:DNA (cytosine-5)-methyltransferase 1